MHLLVVLRSCTAASGEQFVTVERGAQLTPMFSCMSSARISRSGVGTW